MKSRYVMEWPADTGIAWQDDSRRKLNTIIHRYNMWQADGCHPQAAPCVLSMIELGRQTIGAQDGGSGYLEELDGMHAFVTERSQQG